MSAPAVSVVICTFDRLRLLPRALASVAAQTFDDFEVVVVNDGGPDPSGVMERFDFDLRLVELPTNQGVAAAHDAGLRAARGERIAWLDDDDRFLPHHLATLVDAVERLGPDVVPYTDGTRVLEDEGGRTLARDVLPVPADFDRDLLLVDNFIPALGPLSPRELMLQVGGFDGRLPVLEDWEMWLRLSAEMPFVHVPDVTYEYRVRGGLANLTTRATFRFHQALLDVYGKHPVPEGPLADRRRAMIAASEPRITDRAVDATIVVSADGTAGQAIESLRQLANRMGDRSYEVLVVGPRTDELDHLAARVSGPVTFLLGHDPADAMQIAESRAAGREVLTPREIDRPSGEPRAVIVGTGRSGTGYIAAALAAAGVRAGHEAWWNPTDERVPGLDVDASWLAVPFLDRFEGPIWWQVRDPIRVVSSLVTGESVIGVDRDPYWEFQRRFVPYDGDPVRWAVRFTAEWMRRCEARADRTWRLEDVDGGLVADLASDLGVDCPDAGAALASIPGRVNGHVSDGVEPIGWEDLPEGDADVTYLRAAAQRLGYVDSAVAGR